MIRDFMQAVHRDLAPTGTLRAAVNNANPVLVQRDSSSGEPRGLAIDLINELSRRLCVQPLFLGFDGAASLYEASGRAWDVAFLAIDGVRAQGVDFTSPFVLLEGTYLVHGASPCRTFLDLDHAGARIAVSRGSTYDSHLTRCLHHAELVRMSSLHGAIERFLGDPLDAVAGLKQPLASLAHLNAGLRIIEGRFAVIEQAIAVPKGRSAGLRYLNAFITEVKASNLVATALERAAVHGTSGVP